MKWDKQGQGETLKTQAPGPSRARCLLGREKANAIPFEQTGSRKCSSQDRSTEGEPMTSLGVWISLGAIAYSLGIWFLVLWILSVASGWRRLAKRFDAPPLAPAGARRLGSAFIGAVRYNGVLRLAIDHRGMFLSPSSIFRPFHRPLLVPWSEIRIEEATGRTVPGWQLAFPAVPDTRMVLPQTTLETLRPHIAERGTFEL